MATLKNMTRVGADVRQIARLLQAKAPENHIIYRLERRHSC
jgi:hypothetical protein